MLGAARVVRTTPLQVIVVECLSGGVEGRIGGDTGVVGGEGGLVCTVRFLIEVVCGGIVEDFIVGRS